MDNMQQVMRLTRTMALLLFTLLGTGVTHAEEGSDFTFNEGVRYSQWVTRSRINDFYANKTAVGFAVYDGDGRMVTPRVDGRMTLDYVPGLVAKSVIENVQYYAQFAWADSWAMPFFLSIADYGNNFYDKYASVGGSLDDLNAAKLFFGLHELTRAGGAYASCSIASKTDGNARKALGTAMSGIIHHNGSYRIGNGTDAYKAGHTSVLGGWYHKAFYEDEMWLDGSYMGPALFAQLINYSGSTKNIGDDWSVVANQIQALWEMCWDDADRLPYHAFAASPHEGYSSTWKGYAPTKGVYHSASYWGRACGWYLLAIVDILEQMDVAGLSTSGSYATLRGCLAELCAGIAARQDAATGCWYQVLDEDGSFFADSYNGRRYDATYNYTESSASALFAAGMMKAIRKGYISGEAVPTGCTDSYETIVRKAYAGIVNSFFATDGDEGVHLFGSCRSAGLGSYSMRDGSKAYYLLGGDVARVAKSEEVTEGKVLGAFILAATEYERLYQDNTVLFEKDLAPTYALEAGEGLSCPASGSGTAVSYQWYKDGKKIADATEASYLPTASGRYYCQATADGKVVTSSVATVTCAATGVEAVGAAETGGARLYDAAGRRVKTAGRGVTVRKGGKVASSR